MIASEELRLGIDTTRFVWPIVHYDGPHRKRERPAVYYVHEVQGSGAILAIHACPYADVWVGRPHNMCVLSLPMFSKYARFILLQTVKQLHKPIDVDLKFKFDSWRVRNPGHCPRCYGWGTLPDGCQCARCLGTGFCPRCGLRLRSLASGKRAYTYGEGATNCVNCNWYLDAGLPY